MIPYTPTALLKQLVDNQQIITPKNPAGLLQSFRHNPFWSYHRTDTNLFFTAISIYTLRQLYPLLTPDEQPLASAVIDRALPAYEQFRNKDGLGTYNFYGTRPTAHFPHGWLMHRFRHFQLPDDIDDTAMVYLTTQPSETDRQFLHEKLARHANRTRLTVQTTFPEYQPLRAYSTWFGLAMPIEFDACALANMLCVVYQYHLTLDRHAQDSLALLADLVQTNRYRTDPFRAAPNYARAPLIQYHLARLLGTFDPPALRPVRDKLIADLFTDFARPGHPLDQVLLATALMRLGQRPPADVPLEGIAATFASFSFFIAGMLSAYPRLRRWAGHPFWHIRWRCDDHCRVLVLEYLVLRRQHA